tara:strand:- start:7498 stop:7947 length:450 start_codon:yes stop_codon:yes gene_type:complete
MKLLTSLIFILQISQIFSFNNRGLIYKLNNRNNVYCEFRDIKKKNLLINSLNILKSSLNLNNNNFEQNSYYNKYKKWTPPIGYVPESKKNNDIKNLYNEDDLLINIYNDTIMIKNEVEQINLSLNKIKYLSNNIIIRSVYRNDGSNYYN